MYPFHKGKILNVAPLRTYGHKTHWNQIGTSCFGQVVAGNPFGIIRAVTTLEASEWAEILHISAARAVMPSGKPDKWYPEPRMLNTGTGNSEIGREPKVIHLQSGLKPFL